MKMANKFGSKKVPLLESISLTDYLGEVAENFCILSRVHARKNKKTVCHNINSLLRNSLFKKSYFSPTAH
jgi:hypothetical protein